MQPAKWLCLDKSKNTLQLKRTEALVLYCLQQNELITKQMIVNTEYKYCTEQSVTKFKVRPHTYGHGLKFQSGNGKNNNQMVERVVESGRVKVNLLAYNELSVPPAKARKGLHVVAYSQRRQTTAV